MKTSISRRGFLKGAVGLTVAASVGSFGFKLRGAAEINDAQAQA